jgi:hypothetical protein
MIIQLVFLTAIVVQSVSANPDGPPTSACSSMDPSPGHGGSGQTSAAPYTMEVSPTCYTIGQQNTLTLRSTQAGTNINGFFTQLRSSVDNSASYGTFTTNSNSDVKLVNCFGETANAIGHGTRINKVSTTFKWMPPTAATGSYNFVTTVVQYQDTFWVKKVTLTIAPCSTASTLSTVTPTPVTIDPNNTATTTASVPISLTITTGPAVTHRPTEADDTKSNAVIAAVVTTSSWFMLEAFLVAVIIAL